MIEFLIEDGYTKDYFDDKVDKALSHYYLKDLPFEKMVKNIITQNMYFVKFDIYGIDSFGRKIEFGDILNGIYKSNYHPNKEIKYNDDYRNKYVKYSSCGNRKPHYNTIPRGVQLIKEIETLEMEIEESEYKIHCKPIRLKEKFSSIKDGWEDYTRNYKRKVKRSWKTRRVHQWK